MKVPQRGELCGQSSNPRGDAVILSGISLLLLVLDLALGDFLQVFWFSPLLKNQYCQIPVRSTVIMVDEELLCERATSKTLFNHIIFLITSDNRLCKRPRKKIKRIMHKFSELKKRKPH